jgi:hypothetical protein
LELDGSREWERTCDAQHAQACLRELAHLDPGAADTWVVALTAGLPQLSRDFDLLGKADPLGRHLLLHGMTRLDEQDAFDMTARVFTEPERRALERERRRHKGALTLLHAWAHTLGALHGGDAATVMHASYSQEQAAFTADTTELLTRMIDAGLRDDPRTARQTYRQWLDAHPDAFAAAERAQRLSELEEAQMGEAVAELRGTSAGNAMASLTNEDRALLEQLREQARAGNKALAVASAAELAQRYPDVAPLQLFACDLGVTSSCTRSGESSSAAQ